MRSGSEVVVVDNASSDGTVAEVRNRGVRLVANPTNRGFAAAVNQGFSALETRYVLLLNPDAELLGGLKDLCAACDLPGSAGAGGKLLDAQDRPQIGFMVRQLPTPLILTLEALLLNRILPNNPVNRRYRGLQLNYNVRIPVEQPAGAFLMVRRAVWQELGGFDESFFPALVRRCGLLPTRARQGATIVLRSRSGGSASGRTFGFAAIGRETPHLLVW